MEDVHKNEITIKLSSTSIDIAQEKADKLFKTLLKIQELIRALDDEYGFCFKNTKSCFEEFTSRLFQTMNSTQKLYDTP